jgi:hypothetical protein
MSVQAAGVTVSIDGKKVYARSASASSTMSTEGVRTLGFAVAQGQVPSGPQETTVNVEYYIQGSDPVYSIGQSIAANPTAHKGITVQVGGASVSKAHLTSHSVTAEPDGLVTASASFVSYEPSQNLSIGQGTPNSQPNTLPFAHGQGSTVGGGAQSVGFTYEANFEWEPILLMGAAGKPNSEGYIFNGGTVSLTTRTVGGGGNVSYCLSDGTATASANAVCAGGGQTYSVKGKLTSAEINAEVGGFAEGGTTVTQTL